VIFTDVITVDNQTIDENSTLVNIMEPESPLNSEYSSVHQPIDITESIVMLLANNVNEFEISNNHGRNNQYS